MSLSASSKQQQAAKARVLTKSASGNGSIACSVAQLPAATDTLHERAEQHVWRGKWGGFEGAEEGGGAQGYVAQRAGDGAAVSCSEP